MGVGPEEFKTHTFPEPYLYKVEYRLKYMASISFST